MATIKKQPLPKLYYSLTVIYFFGLGTISSILWFIFMNKFPISSRCLLFNYLGFLFISHIIFRPITLRYYLIFTNPVTTNKKPTFLEILTSMSLTEKVKVTAGCFIWLLVLVSPLLPVPETTSEIFRNLRLMGLSTAVGVALFIYILKLRGLA